MGDDISENLRGPEFGNIYTTKKPRKMPGHGRTWLFLAKNEDPLQLGRAAWLTAMIADYSGGTAADLHGTSALPEPANCRLSVRCVPQGVNEANAAVQQKLSDFSSLVYAFRPAPAGLPGNLPGDKAR